MFFRRGENAVVRSIEERIARVTHLPVSHGEGMQVLKYYDGQQYKPHHDFFHEVGPRVPGNEYSSQSQESCMFQSPEVNLAICLHSVR